MRLLYLLLLLCGLSHTYAQGTRILRQPTLSDDAVVFVYADDLWKAPRTGGDAVRLTTHVGLETNPHFSPDGSKVAFSAMYGGNMDVYVVNAAGGEPQRMTWHPGADFVEGWTSDGAILFRSGRQSHPTETNQLYTIKAAGQLPTPINVPRAAYGEVSPNGQYAAYTPITSWDAEWRNYRGGQAMPIWIQDLRTGQLTRTPQSDGERHLYPVWVGNDKVYYLSERDYLSNIWSYDLSTKQEKQETFHKIFDIKSLDSHGDDIVYEQGGVLHILDTRTGTTTPLVINVKGDMTFARERWENVSGRQLSNANLSPKGKRAIFEHRGEILTVPKENGSIRNLTTSSGVADRSPIWSPEGDQIAYFSDESGEYELIIADQYGDIQKRYAGPSKSFYFRPDWSADAKRIAFTDTHYQLWYIDLETGKYTKVDDDGYAHPARSMNPQWSPDSRYIAYAKQEATHYKSIYVYDTKTAQKHKITDGMADATTPVFDQSGDYLYFLGSTNYGLSTGWLDMSSYDPSSTYSLYAAVLYADGKNPFTLKIDDEEKKEEKAEEKDGDKKDEKTAKDEDKKEEKKEEERSIAFDGIMDRTIPVPDVSGELFGLEKAPKGKVTVIKSADRSISAHTYSFEDEKLSDYAGGISAFVTNYDGSQALFMKNGTWYISSLAGKPNMEKDAIKTNIKVKVNPQEEYRQILREGWRYMRDFLYVDNVHGAPWDKVWEWYSPWLKDVRHRTDLNYLIDILSGEVAVGHSYVYGGDFPDRDFVPIGLLGADFAVENGLYRVKKIYSGESWNPELRAPLHDVGIDVTEGDYITSINGQPLKAGDNIYQALEQTANQYARIGVKKSTTDEEKIVDIKPVRSESILRTFDWIEANRRKVDELSNGQLAYVYVPNTGGRGFEYFNRYYFSQQDKKGVIIDERNNGGGSAADYMIDIMGRELMGYFNSRTVSRKPWTTPMAGIWGPKVMIINERAGSGGDLLPYMFKARNLGPLVGTKTWGGLVGTWDTPPFIDGGRMVAPRGGFFDVDGEWAVEGEGVAPDIEVIQDPAQRLSGKDPQLEAAVTEALRLLQTNKVTLKPEPAAPVRSKRPAGWDKQ